MSGDPRTFFHACPRCSLNLSGVDGACSNPKCSWPRPEPGTITTLRLRLGADANRYLHKLRRKGLWPPIP